MTTKSEYELAQSGEATTSKFISTEFRSWLLNYRRDDGGMPLNDDDLEIAYLAGYQLGIISKITDAALAKKDRDKVITLSEICKQHEARLSEEFFLKIIRDWKRSWMNQTQNDQKDYENYHRRAFGIDANMVHSLANKIVKAIKEKK